MNPQRTPQWRAHIRAVIAACLLIVFYAQTWLILTHRVSSRTVFGIEGLVGMALGALTVLLALARMWRWPLPARLRGPESAARLADRLAYTGVIVFLLGAYVARSIIPLW